MFLRLHVIRAKTIVDTTQKITGAMLMQKTVFFFASVLLSFCFFSSLLFFLVVFLCLWYILDGMIASFVCLSSSCLSSSSVVMLAHLFNVLTI